MYCCKYGFQSDTIAVSRWLYSADLIGWQCHVRQGPAQLSLWLVLHRKRIKTEEKKNRRNRRKLHSPNTYIHDIHDRLLPWLGTCIANKKWRDQISVWWEIQFILLLFIIFDEKYNSYYFQLITFCWCWTKSRLMV